MAVPSNYDITYNMTNLMGVVDGTTGADELARPGIRVIVVDVLSQSWQEIINGIQSWYEVTWTGEKITTLCFRYHGTPSTWLITLAFNALGTPMELRPGMLLRIPQKSEIDRNVSLQLAATVAGSAGRTITI